MSEDGRRAPECALIVEPGGPGARAGEPVRCGIPFPRGALPGVRLLALEGAAGGPVPVQVEALEAWPDGSVRWALLDWRADVSGGDPARFSLRTLSAPPGPRAPGPLRAHEDGQAVEIDTGAASFRLDPAGPLPFAAVRVGGEEVLDARGSGLLLEDGRGAPHVGRIDRLALLAQGPVRATVALEGVVVPAAGGGERLLEVYGEIDFFAGSPTVRVSLGLWNPRAAKHPGGIWELGNAGSVLIEDASLALALARGGEATIRFSAEPGAPLERAASRLEIYQDSSGGENWRARTHVDRDGRVPNAFRGYRLHADGVEREGLRATPVVVVERGGAALGFAMQYFWQNFPKAVEASARGLVVRLFPGRYAAPHEIQGGERKTHEFFLAFGPDPVTEAPLDWCRAPSLARATPAWYCGSGAVPYLLTRDEAPADEHQRLCDAAIEGEDRFEAKRERQDEYGWRHFGDIVADHEAVYDPTIISHYNNQYDAVAGFARQFMRTGDARWWRLMDETARHVTDIDVYHTDRDKAAYNGGLFWHTQHYLDAGKATHRSYPRATCGGGPACEHGYATGLALHHVLTGDRRSRDAVLSLARWVIDMDDGRKSRFRWIDRGPTGLASATASDDYHGPGRGPGNSVRTLLDAHRLTGCAAYLEKAEELVRRCIHPRDDIPARSLLDAERRWSYTVFLQTLARYLDEKAELGRLDAMYGYARESLLHYARWMAENEYPYLEKPEILEYPNETWAAQDMRKCEVLGHAARHADGVERERFCERAEFFYRYSTETLAGMPTRTLARPVVLMLENGAAHAWLRSHARPAPAPAPTAADFGAPLPFVAQKRRMKRRLAIGGASLAIAMALASALYLAW